MVVIVVIVVVPHDLLGEPIQNIDVWLWRTQARDLGVRFAVARVGYGLTDTLASVIRFFGFRVVLLLYLSPVCGARKL